ncbi:2-polyprenyl-6-methoxyphenol hydroxylase [Roseomonas nepalensis]|uniref:2-polyprenyl-6-methoxyphenol hydroxylase n=1 Tax=Muricoccus nepalensis TaxID=1854500 RepID=A0A502F8V3_9PROT|nr:FAD-dependent monooxygenase [Roseomonas nepalensis]TPG45761.1 2-polyprenyl-6-methoxyphenol hydroxylase [Roseomonas nepalensis]
MRKLRVAVAGGSLGGLFAAILLRQDGHEVRVFERSSQGLEGRGAGLVPQREVFEVLRQIGVEDAVRVGVVARDRITLDRDGAIAQRQATPQMQASWDHLYSAVRRRLDDGDYHLGRTVQGASQSAAEAVLHFADGSTEGADLVLGADGLGSVLREAVTGLPSPNRYAGYVAWRGLVPEADLPAAAAALLLDRFAFYTVPGSQILGYSVAGPGGETQPGSRRYNWVWYRPVAPADLVGVLSDASGDAHPYSLSPGQLPAARAEGLRDDGRALLPPAFAAAVAAETRPFVQAIFDYEAPRMASGRLALLGDAAFVVRPHTAMGVAKAAGDAMALRAQLGRLPLDSALQAYERERSPVGTAIAAYGRRLGAALG